MLGRFREKHGSLARGVAATDDRDLVARAQLRLHARGRVIHARTFELRHVCNRGLAVPRPRRDDHGPRVDATAILHLHGVGRSGAREFAAPFVTITCAPNFWACAYARAVGSTPEMPAGNPR